MLTVRAAAVGQQRGLRAFSNLARGIKRIFTACAALVSGPRISPIAGSPGPVGPERYFESRYL